jgi:hypothetical protein
MKIAAGSTKRRISQGRRCGRFSALPRHPKGAPLPVSRRQLACGHERQVASYPSRKTIFEDFGRTSGLAQQRRDALAELAAVVTDHDDRSAAKLRRPIVYGIVRAANRAGDEPRIGRKIIVGPHV